MALDYVLKLLNRNGEHVNGVGSKRGDLYITKRVPDFARAVMDDKIWQVQDQTTTAILNAPPTTTAGLTVQNPASSGKWYCVYGVSEIVDVNPAALTSWAIWHCAHKLAVAALTRDITLAATGAGAISGFKAGQSAYNGQIILDRGATVVDDGWAPLTDIMSNVVNSQADMARLLWLPVPVVIPPSFHWSMQVVGGSTTTESGLGLVWGEFDEDELR